jgi:hypothetical protein
MPKRKHVNKVKVAPRTDANQGVREHEERVRKQNEYIIRKIAEYKARQEAARAAQERGTEMPQVIDGYKAEDEANA